jgi:hypothetical protein
MECGKPADEQHVSLFGRRRAKRPPRFFLEAQRNHLQTRPSPIPPFCRSGEGLGIPETIHWSAMSETTRIYSYASPERSNSTPIPSKTAAASPHDDRQEDGIEFGIARKTKRQRKLEKEEEMEDQEMRRPPYIHVCVTDFPFGQDVQELTLLQSMLAGGLGGSSGDMLMHSLDTVKTRQQGDPHIPPKYTSMSASYSKIFRQEGIRRGLYSGVTPAFLGSFPGTVVFFGVYEYTKRHMLDAGVNPSMSYLAGGKTNPHCPFAEVLTRP